MLVLVAAAVATRLAFPIALGIGALLAILVLSYRQTIAAYPSAGGAMSSRDNFGPRWALVAGSALLVDYVLTVAERTSGVAALTTALPPLQPLVLPLSLAAIGLITWANLRGAGVWPHLRGADLPVRRLLRGDAAGRHGPPGRHLDPIPAAGTARCPGDRIGGGCWCCTPSPPAAPP